jgi:hypothetical protein
MSQIQQAIRAARAHEDAAGRHEDKYEQQMKSAGESMYSAFTLALRAAPEYQGRQINDAVILKIYKSTSPRKWWDAALAEAGIEAKNARDWSMRLIQWSVDFEGAQKRRGLMISNQAEQRKKVANQTAAKTHGVRTPRASQEREAVHAAKVTEAAHRSALGGREAPSLARETQRNGEIGYTLQDCYGEINRIKVALGRMKAPAQFNEAIELLKAVARDLEKMT